MDAAVKFAESHYARGKLIVWGNSYSASLALKIASLHSDVIDGVLAFAPGEYFWRFANGSGDYVTRAAATLRCPVFITSARSEHGQ